MAIVYTKERSDNIMEQRYETPYGSLEEILPLIEARKKTNWIVEKIIKFVVHGTAIFKVIMVLG